MPFKNGMKIILINETDTAQSAIFYDVDYTIGDARRNDHLYFHAYYRREDSTEMRNDYEFLPKLENRPISRCKFWSGGQSGNFPGFMVG